MRTGFRIGAVFGLVVTVGYQATHVFVPVLALTAIVFNVLFYGAIGALLGGIISAIKGKSPT